MAEAFVLINTKRGREAEVMNELSNIRGVSEFHTVNGVYDIIAHVEAETTQELREVIKLKLRPLDSVNATLSMVVQ